MNLMTPDALAPETLLVLAPEKRDRADFARWQDDSPASDLLPVLETEDDSAPDAADDTAAVPVTAPDASERLLTRLVMLYNRLWFLSTLPENDRGGAFAGNWWLCDKVRMPDGDRPNVATVRRWIGILEQHGWVRRARKSKDRIIECLATPDQIRALLPRFARFLRSVLRGKSATPPISSERRLDNYNPRQRVIRPKKPLSAKEESVVVQAANAGMIREDAEALVRRKGIEPILDALAVLRHQVEMSAKSGKERIEDKGAYLAGLVKRAAAGSLVLPKAIVEARDHAERKAERERAAANRVVVHAASAPAISATQAASPDPVTGRVADTPPATVRPEPASPDDEARRRISLLPPEWISHLEVRARAMLEAAGGAGAMMVRRIKAWDAGAGGVLRVQMLKLLQDEGTPGKLPPNPLAVPQPSLAPTG